MCTFSSAVQFKWATHAKIRATGKSVKMHLVLQKGKPDNYLGRTVAVQYTTVPSIMGHNSNCDCLYYAPSSHSTVQYRVGLTKCLQQYPLVYLHTEQIPEMRGPGTHTWCALHLCAKSHKQNNAAWVLCFLASFIFILQ